MRPENTHWLHRSAGFGDDEADAALAPLECAVGRACAFRKENDPASCAHEPDDFFQCRHVVSVTIHRNDINEGEQGAEHRYVEECLAGKIIDGTAGADADERRIKIALVIGGKDDGSFFDQSLAVDHPEAEETPGENFGKRVPEIVGEGHREEDGKGEGDEATDC